MLFILVTTDGITHNGFQLLSCVLCTLNTILSLWEPPLILSGMFPCFCLSISPHSHAPQPP